MSTGKSQTHRVGNSRAAPPHRPNRPRFTRHVSILPPLRRESIKCRRERALTYCSPTSNIHARGDTPRQDFGPAERSQIQLQRGERAQIKRYGVEAHVLLPRDRSICQTGGVSTWAPLSAPRIQTHRGNGWELTSSCSPAPVRRAKRKATSALCPRRAQPCQTHRGGGRDLTKACSHAPIVHAKGDSSCQHVGPAKRAQIKRTGEVARNSRAPAPTHPVCMPGARRQ